jgi:hypothetical protein
VLYTLYSDSDSGGKSEAYPICGLSITFDDLFEQADKNLYTAKQNGRNQMVYKSPPVKIIWCSEEMKTT